MSSDSDPVSDDGVSNIETEWFPWIETVAGIVAYVFLWYAMISAYDLAPRLGSDIGLHRLWIEPSTALLYPRDVPRSLQRGEYQVHRHAVVNPYALAKTTFVLFSIVCILAGPMRLLGANAVSKDDQRWRLHLVLWVSGMCFLTAGLEFLASVFFPKSWPIIAEPIGIVTTFASIILLFGVIWAACTYHLGRIPLERRRSRLIALLLPLAVYVIHVRVEHVFLNRLLHGM